MSRFSAGMELGSSSKSPLIKRKKSRDDGNFRLISMKKFLYFAWAYSSTAYNFDIFSKVCDNVSIFHFILCEATIGITYMCMDSFIKLYTKRFDCNTYMNPLLRGVSYGRFLQTSLFVILHASYLADSIRFLVVSFREVPPWSECETGNISGCIPARDIILRCYRNATTNFTATSAYHHYINSYGALDRNALTTRFFILGLVWLMVFFFASAAEEIVVKIYKVSFMLTSLLTFTTMLFIMVSTNNIASEAFLQMLDVSAPTDFMLSVKHVSYAYGIGFLGIYDYGTMSTFTMVDTATVIFIAVFTTLAFLRSWIVKILVLVMKRCVPLERQFGTHVLFYAILPLTTEFLFAHKLYLFYIYGNVLLSTLVYMTNLMYILAKFLSYEFRSVKQIYIVGLLCCAGFALSMPLLALMSQIHRVRTFTTGVDIALSYLGGFYVAIVMWLYGLEKFSTDIQFWLGFKPTRFWTISWGLLPVALFYCTIREAYFLTQWDPSLMKWSAVSWASFTFLIVAAMNIKSMAAFLMKNNIAGVFKPHRNYGPPEPEDRKRRLYYSEFTRQRQCKHNCLVIDEWFDCSHNESILESTSRLSTTSSDTSSVNFYDENTTRIRNMGALSPLAPPPS